MINIKRNSFEHDWKFLGAGAFGKVYKVTLKNTKENYAIKVLSKNQI